MALKIAISGKGGVGKSTLAGTLARLYANAGCKVLAIDADPDANLASAVGLTPDERDLLHTIAEERKLIEERTGAKVSEVGQIFSLNPDVTGIAEKYAVRHAGVDVIIIGSAQKAGGGCACPESVLLKSLVRYLVLKRDEVVILDMEAGIEHLGRGTAMGVDLMIAVVEPGKRSVETAHRVKEMGSSLGISNIAIVLNKSTAPAEDLEWIKSEFGENSVLGVIPFDSRIALADRKGCALIDLGDDELMSSFRAIYDKINAQNKS